MKISADGKDVFELSEIQKKVIKDKVASENFEEDMLRRLQWVLIHKYEQCFAALKKEWDPKLVKAGIAMIPTDPDAYAQLVFDQPDYLDMSARKLAFKELGG